MQKHADNVLIYTYIILFLNVYPSSSNKNLKSLKNFLPENFYLIELLKFAYIFSNCIVFIALQILWVHILSTSTYGRYVTI